MPSSSSFPSHQMQLQLLGFLQKTGECYKEDKRAEEFIPNLLDFNVPRLFAIEEQQDDVGEESSVADKFVEFLKGYMKSNSLHSSLLNCIDSWLKKLNDQQQHDLQKLIFSVLQLVSMHNR